MRTIGAAGRAERRRTVVALRAKGWSFETIAQHTGLSRTGVFNICKRIETVGRTAIEDRPRGRPVGLCRKLSAQQEAQVRKLILDKTPDQLRMDFALWNRMAVMQLIDGRLRPRGATRCFSGQPQGPPQQAGQGLAGGEQGAHRGVLPAQLQPGAQPGRDAQCELEAGDHHCSACQAQRRSEGCRHAPFARAAKVA
jgi:transposase